MFWSVCFFGHQQIFFGGWFILNSCLVTDNGFCFILLEKPLEQAIIGRPSEHVDIFPCQSHHVRSINPRILFAQSRNFGIHVLVMKFKASTTIVPFNYFVQANLPLNIRVDIQSISSEKMNRLNSSDG
jgi:hypothetical protein